MELPAPFALPGRSLEPISNGWPRRMAAASQEEQKPAYRPAGAVFILSTTALRPTGARSWRRVTPDPLVRGGRRFFQSLPLTRVVQ
jgi:hypothetical protein